MNEELLQEAQEEAIRREEELERKIQAEREKRMEKYLLMLLEPLTVQEETTVSNVLENLRKKDPEEYNTLVNQLDFYTFVVQLHQMGEIPLLDLWESQTLVLDELPRTLVKIAAANRNIRDIRSFELQALDKIIYFKSYDVDFRLGGALRGTAKSDVRSAFRIFICLLEKGAILKVRGNYSTNICGKKSDMY